MKTLAVLCNLVSILFTCFVLATDGPPTKAVYIILALLMMAIPIFTVFALVPGRAGQARPMAIRSAAAIANVVLLGLFCLALVAQLPHPSEPGFVEYVVLMMVTPILSAVVLFRGVRSGDRSIAETRGQATGDTAPR